MQGEHCTDGGRGGIAIKLACFVINCMFFETDTSRSIQNKQRAITGEGCRN